MDVLSYVRKTCAICVVALMLLRFSIGSTLGVKYDLILALRSQSSNNCVKLFTDMPWSTCNRVVRNGDFILFPPTETPDHY